MPFPVVNGVPSSFTQGDTVLFTVSFSDFPSSAYSLQMGMLGPTGTAASPVDGSANADGSFTFTLTATVTNALTPGNYTATFAATETATDYHGTTCAQRIFVRPNPLQNLAPTAAMTALATLKTAYASLTDGTLQTFSGGGQSWSKRNLSELRREIDRLQVEVNNELRALGLSAKGGAKTLVARF